MASQWPPKKGVAYNVRFRLYNVDGTVILNPGTYSRWVAKDGGAADITPDNAVTEVDPDRGRLLWVLSATEMTADEIEISCVDDTSGCIPFTLVLNTVANTQDGLETKVDNIATAVITNAAGTDVAADIIALQTAFDAGATTADVAVAVRDVAIAGAAASSMGEALAAVLTDTGTTLPAQITAPFKGGFKKGTQYDSLPFFMVLSTDHVTGAESKTVTAKCKIDDGAWGSCASTVVESAQAGSYALEPFLAADNNGDTIAFEMTAAGCDPFRFVVVTSS